MILVLDIITVIFSGFILLKIKKGKICSILLCLLIFDIAYVMPVLFKIFLGNPKFEYYGFKLALSDFQTCIIYDLFVIIVQAIYYRYIKKKKLGKTIKNMEIVDKVTKKRLKLRKNKILFILSIFLMLVPIFGWLFAPNPSIYFKGLGVFAMNKVSTSSNNFEYFTTIIKYCNYIGAISIIVLKFIDINDNILLKIYRAIILTVITFLNGKRTFFSFILLALLAIDMLSNKKRNKKIMIGILTSILLFGYFVVYAYISGKYEYNTNWYSVISEYFFRGNTVKVAIYAILNPDKLKILDYPGQTMIFNLCYFIPRTLWANKPYQYPVYFTSRVTNFSKELINIGWYFQTGLFGEIISNFGLVGIIIGPIIIRMIGKISDNSNSLSIQFIGTLFACFIQVFEYSDMFKVLFLVWVMLVLKNKIFSRREEKNE